MRRRRIAGRSAGPFSARAPRSRRPSPSDDPPRRPPRRPLLTRQATAHLPPGMATAPSRLPSTTLIRAVLRLRGGRDKRAWRWHQHRVPHARSSSRTRRRTQQPPIRRPYPPTPVQPDPCFWTERPPPPPPPLGCCGVVVGAPVCAPAPRPGGGARRPAAFAAAARHAPPFCPPPAQWWEAARGSREQFGQTQGSASEYFCVFASCLPVPAPSPPARTARPSTRARTGSTMHHHPRARAARGSSQVAAAPAA